MSASLSALESASVESVGQTPNARHQVKNPGWSAGQLVRNAVARANGRRKVKRPQTLMYSSSAWPRRFMAVLRSTWNSAAASARGSQMAAIVSQGSGGTAGWAQAKSEAGTRARVNAAIRIHGDHSMGGEDGVFRLGLPPRGISLESVEYEPRVLAEMEEECHEIDCRFEVFRSRQEHGQHVAPEVPCRPAPKPEPPCHCTECDDIRPASPRRSELLGLPSEAAGDRQHPVEIGLRSVQATQDRGEVRENLRAGPRRCEVQTARGLIHLARPRQRIAIGQSSLSSEPARQLSIRERGEQSNHRHRDPRGFHTRRDRARGLSSLAIEPEDEAGGHDHPVIVEAVHALHDGVARVLLLLGTDQELFIRRLDADEDVAKVHGFHHAKQLHIIREVDGRLGAEEKRKPALLAPRQELRQEPHHGLFVGDEVVIDEIHMTSVVQLIETFQFSKDLVRGFRAGLPAVELDDVTELAVERAAAGKLDPDVQVLPELQKVEARRRALGHVGLLLGAVDPVRGSGFQVGEKLRDRHFSFIEHQVIRVGVDLRLAGGVLAADDDPLPVRVTELDEREEVPLLRDHAASHDDVGPVEQRRIHLSHVEIEEPDRPLLGQERRDRDQTERGRRISSSEELADLAVVPVAELRESRRYEEAPGHRVLLKGGQAQSSTGGPTWRPPSGPGTSCKVICTSDRDSAVSTTTTSTSTALACFRTSRSQASSWPASHSLRLIARLLG